MTSEIRPLRRVTGSDEGLAVLVPDSPPAMAGAASNGIDWACQECGTVLAIGAYEGQFIEIVFSCPTCGALGGSPLREPGDPMIAGTVMYPAGRYRLSSTVNVPGPVPMASKTAVDAYVYETGFRAPDEVPTWEGPGELTSGTLLTLARELETLLDRGERGKPPPPSGHHLLELAQYAKVAAAALERTDGAQITLDGNLIAELHTTATMFRRWSHHPAWPHLVAALRNSNDVQHNVMLLTVASYLVDHGNGIGLMGRSTDRRIPDAWVRPSLLERLELEVKTPQALRGPRPTLAADEAFRILEKQLRKAGSTARGQIDPEHSGVVVVGAYHAGTTGMDVLEAAATRLLMHQRKRKRHIAAVILTDIGYKLTIPGEPGKGDGGAMTPSLDVRVVRHPGYEGGLRLSTETPPWMGPPAPV
ncbi:MAG: hypothetical protein ACYDGR_00235 [Candidatus Dormibacteria bacterium]